MVNKTRHSPLATNWSLRPAFLPKETIIEVENFLKENKHQGYATKDEFVKEAIRFKL